MTDSLPSDAPDNISSSAIGVAGAEKLSLGVIFTYSLPRIGFGVMGTLFATYLLKFSTDVLSIAPAAIGAIIFGSRLWDAISDPLVGYLSDRTNSRFGRRRSWLFMSAIPMGLGLVMIWSPPTFIDGITLLVWMGVALLVYETASTAFFIPHGALGVELTPNYHERTRLYGYAHMIGAFGSILGIISLYFMGIAEDKRAFAFGLSIIAGICVAALVLWSTAMLPERADYQGRGTQNPFKSFMDVFRNPHSLLLLTVFAIETFGAASIAMLAPYLVDYVIPEEDMLVSKSAFLVSILVIYILAQVVFTPLWIKVSRLIGKKILWAASMWLNAITFIGYFFALDHPHLIWVLSFMLGLAGGIGAVVAPAIKADIIDYDEYLTGERKEGSYLAVWNLVRKTAGSVTALLTGLVLQYVGYVPNMEQPEEVKFAMRAMFALLPASCYIIGATIFIRFSFNEREHNRIRKILEERQRVTERALSTSH